MIDFMLLSAPRSASTWASAWLSTDTTLCLHDPLWRWHYSELDAIESPKRLGIACTGVALFPDWVNAHPARKIILHRDLAEVDASLEQIGMSACSQQWEGALDRIEGVHVAWTELFTRPRYIYEYLLDLPFDPERWAVLREINMQPHFQQISVDQRATARLMAELRAH
jgi:hypothetical protein